jgi:uncharacterized protein
LKRLEAIIRADPDLMRLLELAREAALPQWRIVSGCLYQTVWNELCGFPRGTGIQDIDLIYFDDCDLSWEAEDAVIRRVQSLARAADVPAPPPFGGGEGQGEVGARRQNPAAVLTHCDPFKSAPDVTPNPHLTCPLRPQWGRREDVGVADLLQIRNQARVHLWFEQHFGAPYPPLHSADESLSRYPATVQAIGVRLEPDGTLDLIAPFGVDDVFDMVMRPNPNWPHQRTFDAKVTRARAIWPGIRVA